MSDAMAFFTFNLVMGAMLSLIFLVMDVDGGLIGKFFIGYAIGTTFMLLTKAAE